MLRKTPTKTNAERQREFRERNPGYYTRLRAKRREKYAALQAQAAVATQVPQPQVLMLPAPAAPLIFPWQIANTDQHEREAVAVARR